MKRLTEWRKGKGYIVSGVSNFEHTTKLAEYEDLGYTPEELQLCFNPPDVLYTIEEDKVLAIHPVEGEELEFSNGNVYWNCMDVLGNYAEQPLDGLHEDYFQTSEEAKSKLN